MSYPLKQAYIHHGSWDDETRQHPAMNWMENYTKDVVDARKFIDSAPDEWHTSDWTLQKSTGEQFKCTDKAWAALKETYAPFAEHVHDPQFLVCWEMEKGWGMLGIARLWWNLQAPPSGGEKKIMGHGGKEWDGVTPGAFFFEYVKSGKNEIKLARSEIFSDPSAALVAMLKRGMLKPEQLTQ